MLTVVTLSSGRKSSRRSDEFRRRPTDFLPSALQIPLSHPAIIYLSLCRILSIALPLSFHRPADNSPPPCPAESSPSSRPPHPLCHAQILPNSPTLSIRNPCPVPFPGCPNSPCPLTSPPPSSHRPSFSSVNLPSPLLPVIQTDLRPLAGNSPKQIYCPLLGIRPRPSTCRARPTTLSARPACELPRGKPVAPSPRPARVPCAVHLWVPRDLLVYPT